MFLLVKESTGDSRANLAAGSCTDSEASNRNSWMEQFYDMYLDGCLLRNSAIRLRQNFLLICLMDKGILLMLLKNLFILKLML